jgi:hypothetical protein
MATPKKLSLAEFAAEKAPPPCRVCILPEREEIDEAYKTGVARRLILEWLREVRSYANNGPTGVSDSALDKHLTQKHHLKG